MADPNMELLLRVVDEVASGGQFILRARCAALERELCAAYGSAETVLTSSPQAGLLIVLVALDVVGTAVAVTADAPDYAAAVVERAGGSVAPIGVNRILANGADTVRIIRGGAPAGCIDVRDLGPGSAVGGIGEAAAIHLDDVGVAARIRMLRNHGQDGRARFLHHLVGFNARMDEICAGYLLARRPWAAP